MADERVLLKSSYCSHAKKASPLKVKAKKEKRKGTKGL